MNDNWIIIISAISGGYVTSMSAESLTGNAVADMVIAGIVITSIIAGITIIIHKVKGRRKKGNFDLKEVQREKKKSLTPPQSSSVAVNMRVFRNIANALNPQPLIFNKTLNCGCKAKDEVIVKLCSSDRQRYIMMMYDPPEGYYISDDTILD